MTLPDFISIFTCSLGLSEKGIAEPQGSVGMIQRVYLVGLGQQVEDLLKLAPAARRPAGVDCPVQGSSYEALKFICTLRYRMYHCIETLPKQLLGKFVREYSLFGKNVYK